MTQKTRRKELFQQLDFLGKKYPVEKNRVRLGKTITGGSFEVVHVEFDESGSFKVMFTDKQFGQIQATLGNEDAPPEFPQKGEGIRWHRDKFDEHFSKEKDPEMIEVSIAILALTHAFQVAKETLRVDFETSDFKQLNSEKLGFKQSPGYPYCWLRVAGNDSEEFNRDHWVKLDDDTVTAALKSLRPARHPIQRVLQRASNIVLEGVPGTGKTYAIKRHICHGWKRTRPDGSGTPQALVGEGREAYAITLHPATTYEDFVEGLRPAAPSSFTQEDSQSAEDEPSVPFDAQSPGPRKANPAHSEKRTRPSETRDEAKWAKSISNREQGEQVDHIVSRSAFLNYFHVWNPAIHGPSEGSTTFRMQDGFFLRVCAEAVNNPNNDYVVLLDEINRCNVPKVMGDLLTTIERSKRAKWVESDGGYWDLSKCQVVTLPGSKRLFFVPENVYVVATMNTTDRSVAPLDAALRRRFAFVRLWPKGFDPSDDRKEPYDFWKDEFQEDQKSSIGKLWTEGGPPEEFKASLEAWIALNKKLSELGPDAMLGHSYLFDLAEDMLADESKHKDAVRHHWNFHILPQLIDMAVSNNLEAKLVVPGSKPATAELGDVTKVVSEPLSKSGFALEGTLPASSGLLQVPTLRLVDTGSTGGNIASTGEEILFRDATPTKLTSPDNWKDDQHRFFYVPKLSFRESALKSAAEKAIDLEHAKPAIIVQSATRTDWPSKVYGHRADAVKALMKGLPNAAYIKSVYVSDTDPPTIVEVKNGDRKTLPSGNHRFAILLNEPLKKDTFDKLMDSLKKAGSK